MAILHVTTYVNGADMLNGLATFLQDNGWTIDRNDVVSSTQRRLQVHKSSDFFSFRTYFNQYDTRIIGTAAESTYPFTGLMMTGHTSYNSGQDWHTQPGAPMYTSGSPANNRTRVAGMCRLDAAIDDCWFFTVGNTVFVICKSNNVWQWVVFGSLIKFGSWVGGQFFAGSSAENWRKQFNNHALVQPKAPLGVFGSLLGSGIGGGCVHIGADYTVQGLSNTPGWARTTGGGDAPFIRDGFSMNVSRSHNGHTSFSNRPPLDEISVFATADGDNNIATTPIIPLGYVEGLYQCNIEQLNDAAVYNDLAPDSYRVFPIFQKPTTPNIYPTYGNADSVNAGFLGLAIKLVV